MTTEQGKQVAATMNATYMECSSKEMTGVEDIFNRAITVTVGEEEKRKAELQAPAKGGGGGGGGGPAKRKKNRSCMIL